MIFEFELMVYYGGKPFQLDNKFYGSLVLILHFLASMNEGIKAIITLFLPYQEKKNHNLFFCSKFIILQRIGVSMQKQ